MHRQQHRRHHHHHAGKTFRRLTRGRSRSWCLSSTENFSSEKFDSFLSGFTKKIQRFSWRLWRGFVWWVDREMMMKKVLHFSPECFIDEMLNNLLLSSRRASVKLCRKAANIFPYIRFIWCFRFTLMTRSIDEFWGNRYVATRWAGRIYQWKQEQRTTRLSTLKVLIVRLYLWVCTDHLRKQMHPERLCLLSCSHTFAHVNRAEEKKNV